MSEDTTVAQPRTRQQHQIDRAVAKAYEQARAGNPPILLATSQRPDSQATHQVWSVGSRTTGGTVYTIDLVADADGIATLCDCPTAGFCWHRATSRLAALGCIGYWRADTGELVEAQPARCDDARQPESDDVAALRGHRLEQRGWGTTPSPSQEGTAMAWNGNHSRRGERGPASPHHCGHQQVTRCAICGMPTNRRFLDADDRCGDCRLALLKMAAEDRRDRLRLVD